MENKNVDHLEDHLAGVEFIELNPSGGKAMIDAIMVEFKIVNSNAYFSLEDGKPEVYAVEEDSHGIAMPRMKAELKFLTPMYNGTGGRLLRALGGIYENYRKTISDRKDKELGIWNDWIKKYSK